MDSLIWETASPRTNKSKIVDESLLNTGIFFYLALFLKLYKLDTGCQEKQSADKPHM